MRYCNENKDQYNRVKEKITMNNLEKIMKERRITDVKLGSEIFLSDSSIQGYRYNTKLPSLVSLIKLADYLDVNIDYLLDRTNIPTKVDKLIDYGSEEYMNLVSKYNKLSKENQASVIGYMDGLLKSSSKKEAK